MGRPALLERERKIERLNALYQCMARDYALGLRPGEIAHKYSMTPAYISKIVNSPLFLKEVERLSNGLDNATIEVDKELKLMQARALEIIAEDLYTREASKKRTKVAFDILDRTGFHARQAPQIDNRKLTIVSLTPRPGENPEEAEARLLRVQQKLSDDLTDVIDIEEEGL